MRRSRFEQLIEFVERECGAMDEELPIVPFFAQLAEPERARLLSLWEAARQLEADDKDAAQQVAKTLVRCMPDTADEHGAIVVRTFAETLLGRCRSVSSSGGNLYLGARPPGAQLRAFELLRLRTPLIPFAYAAANKALLHEHPAGEPLTLIDVGIGRGGQTMALLRNPVTRMKIPKLRVVGVEPDSDAEAGHGALELAEAAVLETAEEVGMEVEFVAVARRAELLRAEDFPQMSGRIVANAAFAIHHVAPLDASQSDRVAVLRLMRELGAQAMIMTEPDSDHVEDRLSLRLLMAYRHYRSVSASLEARLSPASAQLVWTEFFAPEVRNVVGHEGTGRTERHEPAPRWAAHLEAAGWSVRTPRQLVPTAGTPEGFALHESELAFRLLFQGVPLLAVLRSTC